MTGTVRVNDIRNLWNSRCNIEMLALLEALHCQNILNAFDVPKHKYDKKNKCNELNIKLQLVNSLETEEF